MDARAVALALALPLTARAAALPARMYPAAPPPPPPGLQPASAGRHGVARACSLGALSPAREVLREHLRTGAAAEVRGRALALAARGLGFHTDGRTVAAQGLGFHTNGRTLTARGLGFHTDDSSIALSYPITSGALTSSNDGLAAVLAFPMDAPPPGTTALAAAQDARVQGLQVGLRRGLSMVCHAYPRGTASSRAHTLLQPTCNRSRPMLGPLLPMPMQVPRILTVRHRYLHRCTPDQNAASDKKSEEAESRWNLNITVGCVLIGVRIVVYLAGLLNVAEFLSHRIKFSEKLTAAAAGSLVLGKALYTVLKQTKDFSQLLVYFHTLYKERMGALDASANKESGARGSSDGTADSSNGDGNASIVSSDATADISNGCGNASRSSDATAHTSS